MNSTVGSKELERMCQDKGIKASKFLQPKADYDPPDLPSVEDFLKASGLSMVPV